MRREMGQGLRTVIPDVVRRVRVRRGDRAERRVPGEVGGLEERLEIPVVDHQ